jgi:hypothetical protein
MSTTTVPATAARRPSRRTATVVSLVAIPAALAVSGLVVAQSSYSAYSATTVSPTSNWATGTVALTDDDANAAAFSVKNARPGTSGSRCLVVTSNGTLPSQVRVYGANGSGNTNLAAYLDLTITQGTGGSFGSCTGFTALTSGAEVFHGSLMTFGTTRTGYGNGVGGWNPNGTAPESRTYKLSYTISPDAPNDTMGGTAAGDIVFEAQNS